MTKITKFNQLLLVLLSIGLGIGILANLSTPQNWKYSWLLGLSILIVLCIWPSFRSWAQRRTIKQIRGMIYATLGFILILQLLVLHFLPATVYHDPFRVLSQAEILSSGDLNWAHSTYFWRYPNNVSLTAMLARWLMVTNSLHLSTNTALHILSVLFLDGFILGSLNFVKNVSQNKSLTLGLCLFYVLSPFAYTYYLQVFYSDLPILCVLLLALTILQKWPGFSRKMRWLMAGLLSVSILFGQLVKPNLIVFGIATGLVLISLIFQHRGIHFSLFRPLLFILVGFALAVPAKSGIQRAVAFTPHTRYELPALHWVYMSYDPKGTGTYKAEDVMKMIRLPSKSSRQDYLEEALPKRLKKLGISGIIMRWLQKIGILLNVHDLSTEYTSGYIEAPAIYQKYQGFWRQYSTLIFQLGLILVYGLTLVRSISLLRTPQKIVDPILGLALLTAVGYLAFHGLIWETEDRYGQVLFPLLLVFCAKTAFLRQNIDQKADTRQHRQHLLGVGGLALGVALISGWLLPTVKQPPLIVAAQKSQLSAQYAVKWQQIPAGGLLTQNVKLNHEANYFSVSVLPEAKLSIGLQNMKTKQVYWLRPETDVYSHRGLLPKGSYQIQLQNIEPETQLMKTVQTKHYQLTPHPVTINGVRWNYTSLLYIALRK